MTHRTQDRKSYRQDEISNPRPITSRYRFAGGLAERRGGRRGGGPRRDPGDPTAAFALARLPSVPDRPTHFGVFRNVETHLYADIVRDSVEPAKASRSADLRELLDFGGVGWVTYVK